MSFTNTDNINLSDFLTGYSAEINKGLNDIKISQLEGIVKVLDLAIKSKKTIFVCGNGGSAAISEHFVCDFLKAAAVGTSIQPIIHSLSGNTPTLTAIANDLGYENIFSFQLEKYGKENDVLVCISSSGDSLNIIKAIKMAKRKDMKTISLVGFTGGKAKTLSDNFIHISNENYGVVEDIHHIIMHILAQFIRLKNLKNTNNMHKIVF